MSHGQGGRIIFNLLKRDTALPPEGSHPHCTPANHLRYSHMPRQWLKIAAVTQRGWNYRCFYIGKAGHKWLQTGNWTWSSQTLLAVFQAIPYLHLMQPACASRPAFGMDFTLKHEACWHITEQIQTRCDVRWSSRDSKANFPTLSPVHAVPLNCL